MGSGTHTELETRQREFEAAKGQLRDLLVGLSDETFSRRADERRWSMAECVDHLIVIGEKLIPRMQSAISAAREKGWRAEGPFRYSRLSAWFVRQMGDEPLPPRGRFKTPRLYLPPPGRAISVADALRGFTELQERFVAVARSADGLDLARIKVASPVTRLLRLSLGQWFRALSGHQRRHLWQAAQVKTQLRQQASQPTR